VRKRCKAKVWYRQGRVLTGEGGGGGGEAGGEAEDETVRRPYDNCTSTLQVRARGKAGPLIHARTPRLPSLARILSPTLTHARPRSP
jgi:hypothetical protein